MKAVSVASLRHLLTLAEFSAPNTTADMLVGQAGAEGDALVAGGFFSPGPRLEMVDVQLCCDSTVAMVETDYDTGGYCYLHPEDGYVPLLPERLRTWNLHLPKLAGLMAYLLGMPASFRPVPLVEGLLWDLGAPRLGKKNIPVLFGVRLSEVGVRELVRRELHLRRGALPALLLTSGLSVARDLTLPMVSKIVPVLDALDKRAPVSKASPAILDLGRLGALADSRSGYAEAVGRPIQCNVDGSWISIHGREFTFRRKQAQIVRILYDAWDRREEWLREEVTLAEAEYDSKRLQDAFRRNAHWREVIEVEDGRCRLRVDERL